MVQKKSNNLNTAMQQINTENLKLENILLI